MIQINAYSKPNIWKNTLSFVIAFTFMVAWLPFIRSIFDGISYQWGTTYFGVLIYGQGLEGDFYFLIYQMALYTLLFMSFYWMRNRKVFFGMLILWFINVFGSLFVEIGISGDTMFHGDTLNVHISIFWIVVPLSLLSAFLIYKVIQKELNQKSTILSWNKTNTIIAFVALAMLPIQLILLSTGEAHETTDEIGVIMAIIQCFMVPFIIKPYNYKKQLVEV